MDCRNALLFAMILAACADVQAQSPSYNLGRTPSAEEIRAFDPWNPVNIDGKGLPAGSGTADEGATIYQQKCVACHGPNGRNGQAPALVISKEPTAKARDKRDFVTRVPFAPTVWDYIHRAMPMLLAPGTLKPDEVYSLTAFLLYKNDVIHENDVLDAQTLPKVKMPNRDGYVPPTTAAKKP